MSLYVCHMLLHLVSIKTCMHTHACTYKYACAHTHMHVHIYTHRHTCMYTYILIDTHACTHTCMYTLYIHNYIHTQKPVYIFMYMYPHSPDTDFFILLARTYLQVNEEDGLVYIFQEWACGTYLIFPLLR